MDDWTGELHRRFVESLEGYAIILLDAQGRVSTWNRGAHGIKGWFADEIIGQHFSRFYTPEAVAVGHPDRELAAAEAVGRYEEEGWRVRADGTRFWAHVTITALRDDNGDLRGFGKVTRDLTERKQAEEQAANVMALLEATARTDFLTGLANRRALDEALSKLLDPAGDRRGVALAMLDLDNFKSFNDAAGHSSGDRFLKQTALRWSEQIRREDLLARYGGEEFTLVMPGSKLGEAQLIIDRVRAATPPPVTCSAGIALWDGQEPAGDLISRADSALMTAKREGRDRSLVAELRAESAAPLGIAGSQPPSHM